MHTQQQGPGSSTHLGPRPGPSPMLPARLSGDPLAQSARQRQTRGSNVAGAAAVGERVLHSGRGWQPEFMRLSTSTKCDIHCWLICSRHRNACHAPGGHEPQAPQPQGRRRQRRGVGQARRRLRPWNRLVSSCCAHQGAQHLQRASGGARKRGGADVSGSERCSDAFTKARRVRGMRPRRGRGRCPAPHAIHVARWRKRAPNPRLSADPKPATACDAIPPLPRAAAALPAPSTHRCASSLQRARR